MRNEQNGAAGERGNRTMNSSASIPGIRLKHHVKHSDVTC
jgi:hypothetical protein